MRKFLAATAAVALAAAPLSAGAQSVYIDLHRYDLTTQSGTDKAWFAVREAADEFCGPIDMPQPIELRSARIVCQADFMRIAARTVEQTRERQLAQLSYRRSAFG